MRKPQYEPSYPARVRQKWYFLVEKLGKSVKSLCEEYAISRKTYYKWYEHDHDHKAKESKNPHPHTKITREIGDFIEKIKFEINYGPRKMNIMVRRIFKVEISTTTIYKYYKKKGLIRRPQKSNPYFTPLKYPIKPKKPGCLVQIDVKFIWSPQGRLYQFTFTDIFTGMQFATERKVKDAENTVSALLEALKYFPFPILGIQTDNGSEFRGAFHQYCGLNGFAHYFIPKRSPYWNGSVERAHGCIDAEYYLNPNRPWKSLSEYIYFYNYERPHLGKYLNGLTPREKYLQWKKTVTPRG